MLDSISNVHRNLIINVCVWAGGWLKFTFGFLLMSGCIVENDSQWYNHSMITTFILQLPIPHSIVFQDQKHIHNSIFSI